MIQQSRRYVIEGEDADLLLLALGYAMGHAAQRGDRSLANTFIRFANRINANNPNWRPYEEEIEPDVE
jgi:hypothetical protein